jgi:hypothetical protein
VVDRSPAWARESASALRAIDEESKLLRPTIAREAVLFNHNDAARTVARDGRGRSGFRQHSASGGNTAARSARSYRTIAPTRSGYRRRPNSDEQEDAPQKSRIEDDLDAIVPATQPPTVKNTGGNDRARSATTVQRELHRMILDINSRYTAHSESRKRAAGDRSVTRGHCRSRSSTHA